MLHSQPLPTIKVLLWCGQKSNVASIVFIPPGQHCLLLLLCFIEVHLSMHSLEQLPTPQALQCCCGCARASCPVLFCPPVAVECAQQVNHVLLRHKALCSIAPSIRVLRVKDDHAAAGLVPGNPSSRTAAR